MSDTQELIELYAEVLLPLPLRQLYTYRIPIDLFEQAVVGKRVFVPFGNKKVYTGLIINIQTQAPQHYEAINIISIIDDNPLIGTEQIKLWQWIADYYMCTMGEVMAAALPSGLKLASETYVSLDETQIIDEQVLDPRELQIIEALKGKDKLRVSDLEKVLHSKSSLVKIIKSLYDRQLILMFEDVPDAYKPKLETYIAINNSLDEAMITDHLNRLESKAKNQFQVLMALLSYPNQTVKKSLAIQQYQLSNAAIKALVDKGLVVTYKEAVSRLEQFTSSDKAYALSVEQSSAVSQIQSFFKEDKSVLLHGVAASGKTFVYIELIKSILAKGQSVLLLIPEIALTEQLIQRLEVYFGDSMMVSHARFSKHEKVEIWNKAQSGEVKLLLGSRSSLFMPMQQLGLIIVDEEHESAYKQYEKNPRYHARDLALVWAKSLGIPVLMGSATPSIESYYNALTGKFGLVELQHKYHQSSPTQIKLINIHKESEEPMQGLFSESLLQAMEACINSHKQVILFQNRKGYVPMLECNVCGWVSKCVNCDIALTYYKYSNNLRCHYCGYQQGNISKCSACGNHSMEIQGYGTERITEELQLLKPEWRVMRFDQDSTRQKNAYRQLLNEFESGAFDVMVGTQMAVKGLDYGKVGLTAVLNVDHLMNIPDYRSNERVFQLLTQLAGRAGRTFSDGQLLVQTKQVNHPLLAFVQQGEYKAFYQQQIVEREQFHYAPFSRLIKLTLKHASAQDIQKSTALFAQLLKQQLGDSVLGPETPYVSKLRNQYLRNILVKYDANKSPKGIKPFILKTFDFMIKQHQIKGLQLQIDVDC